MWDIPDIDTAFRAFLRFMADLYVYSIQTFQFNIKYLNIYFIQILIKISTIGR